ncbi:FxsA family protein [Algicola sagamiensis]|uniref:FxsA family protein n=1 Tax=Algicola sagamiensis TaxID=163869 RepID=UPI0003657844|nr:FxsA family protein [Algicola sagamiensis]
MFRILFVFFIIVPMIEIAILLQVGSIIGGWMTLGLVILTAYFGAKLVKQQGLTTYANLQQKLAQGQMPSDELRDGLCVLVSGILLLTPGIMTDALGFLLLVPAFREGMSKQLSKHFNVQYMSNTQQPYSAPEVDPFDTGFGQKSQNSHRSSVIEGEYERKE